MKKLLIGGSPCTHWSIAQHNGREKEASGIGWELFKCYIMAKVKFKPDFFLYENNKKRLSGDQGADQRRAGRSVTLHQQRSGKRTEPKTLLCSQLRRHRATRGSRDPTRRYSGQQRRRNILQAGACIKKPSPVRRLPW